MFDQQLAKDITSVKQNIDPISQMVQIAVCQEWTGLNVRVTT